MQLEQPPSRPPCCSLHRRALPQRPLSIRPPRPAPPPEARAPARLARAERGRARAQAAGGARRSGRRARPVGADAAARRRDVWLAGRRRCAGERRRAPIRQTAGAGAAPRAGSGAARDPQQRACEVAPTAAARAQALWPAPGYGCVGRARTAPAPPLTSPLRVHGEVVSPRAAHPARAPPLRRVRRPRCGAAGTRPRRASASLPLQALAWPAARLPAARRAGCREEPREQVVSPACAGGRALSTVLVGWGGALTSPLLLRGAGCLGPRPAQPTPGGDARRRQRRRRGAHRAGERGPGQAVPRPRDGRRSRAALRP